MRTKKKASQDEKASHMDGKRASPAAYTAGIPGATYTETTAKMPNNDAL